MAWEAEGAALGLDGPGVDWRVTERRYDGFEVTGAKDRPDLSLLKATLLFQKAQQL